jgi:hypothetical protein
VKRNAGIFGALAVVLAILGMSSLPKNSGGGGAQSTTGSAKRSKSPVKPNASALSSACQEIQRRLRPLVIDSAGRVTSDPQPSNDRNHLEWTPPASCYSDRKSARDLRLNVDNVTFVIATAPNPISTHLALSFDRALEIIQQAAQDNDYSYESSWLPWNEVKDYTHLNDQLSAEDAEEDQEKQPGVLVFRNPSSLIPVSGGEGGLVVFVVSESPTGGINAQEFINALAWIQQLEQLPADREIKILGPTFSGSLPSLYEVMHVPQLGPFGGGLKFAVFSGGVSSESSYNWFKKQLTDEKLGTFRTANEGDALQIDRFCQYVHQQGYDTSRVAFLSEDETAFGGASEERSEIKNARKSEAKFQDTRRICSGASTYLYYPRDIATLRSAYEQQSIFNSSKQASGTNNVATTLRGDLSEPANSEHDTVRSYSGQLTPLAQESVLLDITDVLRAKKIQFVVVRSSNSLDQIFLGQFFRRALPETRIVMDGADLMFRRGAEGASLRGVMMLSTYPLLTWQQDWTSSSNPPLSWLESWISSPPPRAGESYRVFGQDSAEDLYIAARELFPDQSVGDKALPVPIANYAAPAWARKRNGGDPDSRPATWLTVIGHRQFWPVAVLNSNTLAGSSTDSILPKYAELNDPRIAVFGDAKPMGQLPIDFGVVVCLCLVWSVLHLLWCTRGSISPAPWQFRLAYFAPVPRSQHAVLIGFGSVVVASFAVIIAGTSGLVNWALSDWNEIVAAFVLATFVLALFACWKNYNLAPMTDGVFTPALALEWRWRAAIGSTASLVIFMGIELLLLLNLKDSNRIPTFWRSVHLLSGVSPLLPQMFLLGGMYCWFWFGLRGLSLFGNDRPVLPTVANLELADGRRVLPMFSREQAGTPTEDAAMPLGKSYLKLVGMIFPMVAVTSTILLNGRPWLRTLGERSFGIFIFFWISICITLILADTAQAWSTWRRLRVLLNHIDLLPLRRTLNALHGMTWRSVWAMSGDVLAERYRLISRQLEALRHLRNRVENWIAKSSDEEKARTDLRTRIDAFQQVEKSKMEKFVAWYEKRLENKPITTVAPLCEVQEEIASIAGLVLGTVVVPSWRSECESLIIDRAPKTNREDESRTGPGIYKDIPDQVLAGEEFFVLPYLGFIQNILGRIRTTVLGSLCLFVATTLAVSSYPFDPLPVLGGIFLAVFVTTGTTIVVIYAGMHRDATLSYITDTSPGELGGEFWRQVFTFGVGPLIGLLTTLFPSITDFVVSWLQPSAQGIK